MSNPTIVIEKVTRTTNDGLAESLGFTPGVNVIVGIPNTGKSVWLKMIDYVMGDSGTALDAIGAELYEKYSSIKAEVRIGSQSVSIERKWKEPRIRSKILVDDVSLNADEFSEFILSSTNIPSLHYPKGSPFNPNKWPSLSWRSLFRHMYRQWRYWSDIADAQPPGEQLACLLMFLGAAEVIYSKEYEQLVELNKEMLRLEASKNEFISVFKSLYERIIETNANVVSPTSESIDSTISDIDERILAKKIRRETIQNDILSGAASGPNQDYFDQLSDQWKPLQVQREASERLLRSAERRLAELEDYLLGINSAIIKLNRAKSAAVVLADIQITTCPACDQQVHKASDNNGRCFLCHQEVEGNSATKEFIAKRLEFEEVQLSGEREEAQALIDAVIAERNQMNEELREIEESLREIEIKYAPLRQAAAVITPPEISALDVEIGQLQEQRRTMERLRSLLDLRNDRSLEIDRLADEAKDLEASVAARSRGLDLEQRADALVDSMNNYLTALKQHNPLNWTQEAVSLRLREKNFTFQVGDKRWNQKLGGTLSHYFLLAYHYGLLSLTPRDQFHYPGLCIIDFPPALEETDSIADKENFVLEPFVALCSQSDMIDTQVIAAGAAFEGLSNANRIELTKVWK